MKKQTIFLIFILFLSFLSIYLLYQILLPFLSAIIWAVLLAIIFYPLFSKLQRFLKKKGVLPALLMTLLVIFIIVLPFTLLTLSLVREVSDSYTQMDEMIKTGEFQSYLDRIGNIPFIKWILIKIDKRIYLSHWDPTPLILKNINQISTFIFNQTTMLIKGFSTFIVGFFFTLLSLFFLFKDGGDLFVGLKKITPLPAREKDLLIRRLKDMIYATLYGGILIAMIQGFLGGMSFWILGLRSPVFWGTAMALLSFIPLGGTSLIWIPTVVILLITGWIREGLILLGLGIFVIGMVDNLLRPFFVSSKTKVHPLVLFFAVLGGIRAFGFIGVIAGPLVATLFLTVVEIYIQKTKQIGKAKQKI